MELVIEWDVVVVGSANTDYLVRGRALPQPGTTLEGDLFFTGPGGKGANQAVAAARLGARTAFVARVGNDDRGRALIAALSAEGVHVVHVNLDVNAPTGAAVIQVDERGQKQIFAALGANRRLSVDDVRAASGIIHPAKAISGTLDGPKPGARASS